MKKSIGSVFLAFVFLTVLVSGCAPAPTPVPPTFTPSPILPTFTPIPTATETPIPSPTPFPLPVTISVSPVAPAAPAPNIVVTDTRIGSFSKSYKDPEFWVAGRKVTWQDEEDDIWIADVDPNTGSLIPENGQGRLVGRAISIEGSLSQPGSWNGPEWGFSKRGAEVFYTARDAAGIPQIARHNLAENKTDLVTRGGNTGRAGPLPSKNWDDEKVAVMYFLGRFRDNIGRWRYVGESIDRTFPSAYFATSGPQWVDGEPALVSNIKDAEGFIQVALFNISTGTTTPLTQGRSDKFDTYFFRDPELQGRKMFLVTQALAKPTATVPSVANEIVVFQEDGSGKYLPYSTISLSRRFPGQRFNHWSAEPFIYKGKTYISFAVMAEGGETYASPSDIYIASLDGSLLVKMNQNTQPVRCIDPESFPTPDQLFIYYYTVEPRKPRELHRVSLRLP
jgi:hypothetical protein